jgi:hypothetical protein
MSLHGRVGKLKEKVFGHGCPRCGRAQHEGMVICEIVAVCPDGHLPKDVRPWQEPPRCAGCGLWEGPIPILWQGADGKLSEDARDRAARTP